MLSSKKLVGINMALSKKHTGENHILKCVLENVNALIWVQETGRNYKERETDSEYHYLDMKYYDGTGIHFSSIVECLNNAIMTFDIIT